MKTSKEVVEAYMADFNRMDVDAMVSHYAEDGVYENAVKGGLRPPGGRVRGREALKTNFSIVPKVFVRNDFIDNRIYTTPDDEQLVIVENTCECEFRNGTIYSNFVIYRFEVDNGFIQKMTEYVIDPNVQLKAWAKGLTGVSLSALKTVGVAALGIAAFALVYNRRRTHW